MITVSKADQITQVLCHPISLTHIAADIVIWAGYKAINRTGYVVYYLFHG